MVPTPASTQTPVADEIHWTITGQTSVTFDWRGTASVIRYGITSSYGQEVTAAVPSIAPFSSAGPFWEARITGLEENTVYHYSIGGGADHTFKTPPRRGNSDFTVIAQGDIGERSSYSSMPLVQSMIAAERPDFVLALGDLTYGNNHGQAAVDQHFNDVMVWSEDAAYMPAWGNHEVDPGDDLRNYKGRFDLPNPRTSPGSPAVSCCGEDWSWFDYGNARFIAYPEPWSGAWQDWFNRASAIMDSAQTDPAIAYIVTYGHRPAFSTGNYAPGNTQLRAFIDTLGARHSKYLLNLTGHDHNYQRSTPQRGVVHITSGIGGAGLYSLGTAASWTAFQIAHHGALRLRFTQAGIAGRAICGPPGGSVTCVQGSAMDEFFIANPNPDRPPLVTAPALVRTAPGQPATITVTASDPDGEPIVSLTTEASGLPATFEVDLPSNSSGTLTWTPGVADTGRSYPVTFTASNALSSSVTTAIDVAGSDRPPVVTAPNVVLAVPGVRVYVTVQALDPDGEPIASLEAGLTGLPPGHDATFVKVPGDSAGTLSWTPGSADVRTEPYEVTFIASNALGVAHTTAIRVERTPTTVEKRIVGGSDDAEESTSGSVSLTGSDLELVTDASVQVVGLRFTGLAIPPWAQVTSAYVQFKADESHSGATSLTIRGQAADNAPVFTSASRNVSSRTRTTASVLWTPPAWTSPIGQAGAAQRTAELAPVIQEIVGRAGWQSGNALALIVNGTGRRTAETYEGDAPGAALLHVEYIAGTPVNRAPIVNAGADGSIMLPAEAILDGTVSDDGLPSSNLTVDWSHVTGPDAGSVTFTGGVSIVDTRATFSAAGRYVLRFTASDGVLTATDTVAIVALAPGSVPVIVEKRVLAGRDDAEEGASGSIALTSSDLELVTDGSVQVVGLRFGALAIPPGAHVTSAYVQFKVDENPSAATALAIQGQAADSAVSFTSARWNVSSRTRTAATVSWTPPAWTTIGQAGVVQRTPDLAAVIQEIVGRAGWRSGNSLALIVTGTGRRTAEAYEGDAAGASLLHVELAASLPVNVSAVSQLPGDGVPDSTSSGARGPSELQYPPIRGALGARVIPNPMHGEATLQLVTAHAGAARVELFDAAGRRVRVLLDTDYLTAGVHAFPVRAADGGAERLAPGVYFYRARVPGGVGNGRFLILQ